MKEVSKQHGSSRLIERERYESGDLIGKRAGQLEYEFCLLSLVLGRFLAP